MKLRKLVPADAPLMLEWMHDASVVEYMQTDFMAMTLEDCLQFIEGAAALAQNLHLAIADETDTYMGTVSLKNISSGTAEFAITVRKEAMGKGYAQFGMKEIIRIGLEEFGLQEIYWYVNAMSDRAVRFYDKNGYSRVDKSSLPAGISQNPANDLNLLFYMVSAS